MRKEAFDVEVTSRVTFFKANLRMALVMMALVKDQQAIHLNHNCDILKAKGVKSDGARPFLSEMTNTGHLDGVGLI